MIEHNASLKALKAQLLSLKGERRLTCLSEILDKNKIGNNDIDIEQGYVDEMIQLAKQYDQKDKLAWAYLHQAEIHRLKANSTACFENTEKALQISRQIAHPILLTHTLKFLGFYHSLFHNDYDKAKECYEETLKLAQTHKLQLYEARIFNDMGATFLGEEKQYKARIFFQKAIKVFKSIDKEEYIGGTLNNMALLYNDKQKAVELLNEAIRINLKYSEHDRLTMSYLLMSGAYKELGDNEQSLYYALASAKSAEQINSPMHKALSWHLSGQQTLQKAISSKSGVDTQLLKDAEKWSEKLEPLVEKLGIADFKARSFSLKGKIQYHKGQAEQALANLHKASEIANHGTYIDNGVKLEIARFLPLIYEKIEKPGEALHYFKAYHELEKRLTTEATHKNVKELETQFETQQKEAEVSRLQELEKIKNRFFAQITHELRTPLTLIGGAAHQIYDLTSTNPGIHYRADMIGRNTERMLLLVNQLLDIGKLEAGKMPVWKSHGSFTLFIETIVNAFQSLGEQEGIQLDFVSDMDEFIADFDTDKIEKILYNLLSNAFKFTPAKGRIVCNLSFFSSLEKQKIIAEMSVSDTGKGIREADQPHIFDRFYRADDSDTRETEGTGIGLSLAKELTLLMGGTIEVDSTLGKGSTFIVTLPLDLIEGNKQLSDGKPIKLRQPIPQHQQKQSSDKAQKAEDVPILLLIEDNKDMHTYIRSIFEQDYIVLEAYDGEQGLMIADERIPDLIICDVMMPKKNGYEVCQALKSNFRTGHIPVILLTAKAALNSEIKGLEHGADAYMSKPFSPDILSKQVKNLITLRNKLQKKYSESILSDTANVNFENEDAIFLKKTIQIIENSLIDSEFNVEHLSDALHISRSQLHRKLRTLLHCTASDLIRQTRLIKAKKILENKGGNVSSVAYDVGFSSPNYFSKAFIRYYGYSPKSLLK